MFDSHCHLNLDPLFDECESVIARARSENVTEFLVPSTNYSNARRAMDLVENYQGVYMAVGVHPTEQLNETSIDKTLAWIEDTVKSNFKVVAVGEIGLDYYHTTKSLDVAGPRLQKEYFEAQVSLAIKLDLPIIIHNRLATDDLLDILTSFNPTNFSGKAVFHCCPAEERILEFAIKHSLYIGVDGDITYDSEKQRFVRNVPSELLLIETDSPYLTPLPVREQKRFPNEPSHLGLIADCISELKNESVREYTSTNARLLFSIDKVES